MIGLTTYQHYNNFSHQLPGEAAIGRHCTLIDLSIVSEQREDDTGMEVV